MKEKLLELLNLINTSHLTDEQTNKIKDYICYFSECKINSQIPSEQLEYVNTLLVQGSYKIRNFGYPTMDIKNSKIDAQELFGTSNNILQLSNLTRRERYRSSIYPDTYLDFRQKQVLDIFLQKMPRRLFVSAPTSFGKTFLLKEMINHCYENYNKIVIVIPTVALLQEVSSDLRNFFKHKKLEYKIYNSIFRDVELAEKSVFILTPERVVRLFALYPNFELDFFFFDEIYKIDDDIAISSDVDDNKENINSSNKKGENRTLAFRIALYLLLKSKNNIDFYIAGPFIKLEALKTGFKNFIQRYNIETLEFNFEPTLKNKIIFVNKEIKKISKIDGESTQNTNCDRDKKGEKLKYLKDYLPIDRDNQTIFFCQDPRYANEYAEKYYKNSNIESVGNNRLKSFIEHIQNNYIKGISNLENNKWTFVEALEHNVGIHNGALPRYFQREVMVLFNEKVLPELFCTSTIIEGVNSNAKNIVLIQNPIGETDESKKFTLLNINGWAGRYLKHFVGNVVYLDGQQPKLESNDNINLSIDCKFFSSNELSDHDLENIDSADLEPNNKEIQRKLYNTLDKTNLPDEVFLQNRLVERLRQEKILKDILNKTNWSVLKDVDTDNIYRFTQGDYMKTMLSIWFSDPNSDLDNDNSQYINKVKMIANQYANGGYQLVLKNAFEWNANPKNKKKGQAANKIYNQVFRDIRDYVEYKIPLMLSTFEALINQAYKLKKIEKQIDMTKIIKFYEMGVKTELGLWLTERGLPIITIHKIENIIKDIYENLDEQKEYLFSHYYVNKLKDKFDTYEQILINEIIVDNY